MANASPTLSFSSLSRFGNCPCTTAQLTEGGLTTGTTPRDVVDRLAAEVARILGQAEVRERYAALGAEPVGSSPDDFAAYCRSKLAKWARVVRESGAKAD